MAVYTKLSEENLKDILSNYNLGKLDSFKGIEEGIENTNYFLSVNRKKYIDFTSTIFVTSIGHSNPKFKSKIKEVESLEKTERGSAGFGSTGTK